MPVQGQWVWKPWRQCLTAAYVQITGAGTNYYRVLGPFRAGGMLRALYFEFSHTSAQYSSNSWVLSGTGDASAAAHGAGTPIIDVGEAAPINGQPCVRVRASTYVYAQMVFPLGVRVESGSRWIVYAFNTALGTTAYRQVSVVNEGGEWVFMPFPGGSVDARTEVA